MLKYFGAANIRIVREQRKLKGKGPDGDSKVANVVLARCPFSAVRHKNVSSRRVSDSKVTRRVILLFL
jgi:hypothetical protein